jgi:catechol 2,3-dioxygenase-like lactoylglutathione lyase family enzyme
MDRLNHVKILTPDPEAVERFLTEVLDVPEGFSMGPIVGSPPEESRSPARDEHGNLTIESVLAFRGTDLGGVIAGSTESRQVQILKSTRAAIWAIAVGTRNLEAAYARARALAVPCTEIDVTTWGEGGARYFFAEVGGVLFEVLRIENAESVHGT